MSEKKIRRKCEHYDRVQKKFTLNHRLMITANTGRNKVKIRKEYRAREMFLSSSLFQVKVIENYYKKERERRKEMKKAVHR